MTNVSEEITTSFAKHFYPHFILATENANIYHWRIDMEVWNAGQSDKDKKADIVDRKRRFEQAVLPNLRPAEREDYENWLTSFPQPATHIYTFPFGKGQPFYVATRDFAITPLDERNSVTIIVPEGIEFLGGDAGASTILLPNGSVYGARKLQRYSDTPGG